MKLWYALMVLVLLPTVSIASNNTPVNKSGSPAGADGGGLFSNSAVSDDVVKIDNPATVRARHADVHFALLGDEESPADTVILNLFGDASFTAMFERTESNTLGSYAWIGSLQGVEHGQAVLVVTNGVLAGKVSMPGAIYEVRSIGEGLHVVEEVDQSAFPAELHGVPTPQAETSPDITPLAVDACNEITVLVPYTPEARAAAGGTTQIEAIIALAVVETNQSYVNSGLTQRINLVDTLETAAGEAANSFYTDLYALQNTSDGIFDDVDAARESHYADEVALIIEDTAYCGLAYLNSTEDFAFSVTHRTCATGYYSFGHELGHNMSARHDWYVDDSLSSPWSYSKGFVNLDDQWRTIMAYNRRCSDAGSYCWRIQYWSNPNVTYGGDPMGVSSGGPTNCVKGSTFPDPSSCAADNRTTLNNTCSTVANFRVSPRPCGLPIPTDDAQLRDQAAEWLGKCKYGLTHTPPTYAGGYTDVGSGDYNANWIQQIVNDGITEGCNLANTLYCRKDPVTKTQAPKLILIAEHGSGYTPPPAGAAPYTDVPTSHPDVDWIARAKAEGVTTGCGGGNYCPDEVLTQQGFQKMLGGAF